MMFDRKEIYGVQTEGRVGSALEDYLVTVD